MLWRNFFICCNYTIHMVIITTGLFIYKICCWHFMSGTFWTFFDTITECIQINWRFRFFFWNMRFCLGVTLFTMGFYSILVNKHFQEFSLIFLLYLYIGSNFDWVESPSTISYRLQPTFTGKALSSRIFWNCNHFQLHYHYTNYDDLINSKNDTVLV